MSDQNEENKPKIVTPLPIAPGLTQQGTAASARESLLDETFSIHSAPAIDELVRLMARMANFMNLLTAEALRSRNVTAADPSVMAIMNASANLENGAQAQRQKQAMIAAGQFAGVGGPGGSQGVPPFRMN